ncbi:putative sigma-54 modulation protein [Paucidesulfovibrio gracilis DSM 16080]|uniref:Ribosome hibernation promoting factor n=1 Tax=Paucidesulfovibrio gracilis DSM 16080 TaxID=1121449 RepID=A0A1T4WP14_9BACT|nr:ribosome-associated translation inhibitor RaiA [Paucidesulfovibrio gracilis]SKA78361.1 putative sigma-54 modulation protein [Paucidesulfovibrio gracilis DSM 16080]
MNISFNFKNFDPSPHLKEYAAKRFDKVSKFIQDSDESDLQVNLAVEKTRQQADVVLNADSIHISAFEQSPDMYATIDCVVDKLEAQLRKVREKMKDKRRKAARDVRTEYFTLADGGAAPTITGTDNYEPKPMSVEEAAMQLDSLKFEFLVFRNAETEGINVIYRRKGGDYGLIDPGN